LKKCVGKDISLASNTTYLCDKQNKSTILTRTSSLPLYREESSLVDIFILEILVIYLESLSLAHNDDHARGKENLLT